MSNSGKSRCGVLIVVSLLAAGAACTPSDDKPASSAHAPSDTKATASATRASSEQAAAVDAYRAMWADVVAASKTSDADDPRLDDHAKGGALRLVHFMLQKNHEDGVVSRGVPTFAPQVKKSDPSMVVIRDCSDASHWLLYTRDGKLKDDTPGGHHRVDATVRREGDQWLVESLYLHEVGTCLD